MVGNTNYRQLAYQYQLVDWIVVLILLVIDLIMNAAGTPHCRSFEWTDASINYPMKADTFPVYALVLMAIFAPIFYYAFSTWCVDPLRRLLGEPLSLLATDAADTAVVVAGERESSSGVSDSVRVPLDGARPLHTADGTIPLSVSKVRSMRCGSGPVYPWIKAHLWALVLDQFTVDIMKLYAGRLRPDFLDRMAQAGYTAESTRGHDPRTQPEYFCVLMRDHRALREGRLSFPSGHSGTSFAIFTVMSFYFFAHLRPFARQGSLARLLLSLSPLLVPAFCAVSRTRDNKHNFSDIMAGSFIGMAAAVLVLATVFRQAGGPLTVYLARSAHDVEYVKQRVLASHSGSEADRRWATADYNTVSGGNNGSRTTVEMQSARPTTSVDADTVSVPVSSTAGANAGAAQASLPNGSGGAAVVVVIGERELNESPAAVPWL